MRTNGPAGRAVDPPAGMASLRRQTPAQFLGGELLAVEWSALGELLRARQGAATASKPASPEFACDRDRVRVVARDRDRHRLAGDATP